MSAVQAPTDELAVTVRWCTHCSHIRHGGLLFAGVSYCKCPASLGNTTKKEQK